MARAIATKHGDRVRQPCTGATGTVIDVYETKNLGVLRDTGNRAVVVWRREETERTGGPIRTCARCRATDHTAISCTAGDLPT